MATSMPHGLSETKPTSGYWGPVTSSIDWCEENYATSFYLAEFWNTISNVFFMALGIYGLVLSSHYGFQRRFRIQYLGVFFVGLGSAAFHATLQHNQQQSDESPMVWSILVWFYLLHAPTWPKTVQAVAPPILVVYCIVFSILHYQNRFTTVFQVHFGAIVLMSLRKLLHIYSECRDVAAKAMCKFYIITLGVGFLIWLADFQLCKHIMALPINPQGHAWWHVLMGINSYIGPAFAQFVYAERQGLHPRVDYTWGVIPYISVKKGV